MDRKIDDVNTSLAKLRVDHDEAQKILSVPFPQAEELSIKEKRLKTLTTELNLAAMEAKKNAKPKEKTCYFERAKLKKKPLKSINQQRKQIKAKQKNSI